MAFKCSKEWKSWVGMKFPPQGDPDKPNDGKLNIKPEKPNGKFKGKHKRKKPAPTPGDDEFDIDGTCTEIVSPEKHTIDFTTTEGFRYEGTITRKVFDNKERDVAEGTRKRVPKRGEEGAEDGDDWVAVKVGQ